jgi:hypothetical protein
MPAGRYTEVRQGWIASRASSGEQGSMNKTIAVIAASSVLALPAFAHHSGAMFDTTRTVTLTGKVREFQWSNPHCWIQLLVPATTPGANPATEWSIEMASPVQVQMGGWRHGTLKAGDAITVVIHPMRDGTPGGNFISATAADGRALGQSPKAGAQ